MSGRNLVFVVSAIGLIDSPAYGYSSDPLRWMRAD